MTPTATTDPGPLAESCLAHLRVEEHFLRASRTCLAELHEALRQGDYAAVAAARPRQQALAELVPGLQAARTRVAAGLAPALGLAAESLNLSAAAERLPEPWKGQVLAARERLRALAADVQASQQRNATLLGYLRGYVRQVLSELAPVEEPPVRYNRSGSQLDAPLVPLAQGVVR